MFDEMNASPTSVRAHYESYQRWLAQQPADVMQDRKTARPKTAQVASA